MIQSLFIFFKKTLPTLALLFAQPCYSFVFLPDDRVPLTGEKKLAYQYRVGALYAQSDDGRHFSGTAFVFMSQQIVVTAAHVFYEDDGTLSAPLNRWKFYVGSDLTNAHTYRVKKIKVGTTKSKWYGGDWAVALLELPVKEAIPFMPLTKSDWPIQERMGMKLELIGLHMDKQNLSVLYSSPGVDRSRKRFTSRIAFDHNCDAYNGASGAPILTKDKTGQEKVVGIHSFDIPIYNADGSITMYGPEYGSQLVGNGAFDITDDVINAVMEFLTKR